MTVLADTLRAATARLSAAGIDSARLDAEVLLAHALGWSRSALLLRLREEATVPPDFQALLSRRAAREPIAYITGEREFWSLSFQVSPAVLIPRPDSETLVELALAHAARQRVTRVLDLGTGSGCLLLSVLHGLPAATGVGVDASPAALAVAQDNAGCLGLSARAVFQQGDWCAGLAGRFDLVLCNPPYVAEYERASLAPDVAEHEPTTALFAGSDGLADYRRLMPQLPAVLAPGGLAVLELGATQAEAVTALAHAGGLTVAIHPDLAGKPRVALLQQLTQPATFPLESA
jgi:release factor glutamine methyltransferase